MVWCLRPLKSERHVLHSRTTHREVEWYQVALLQGPQLLATSHCHDDPPVGLLLELWARKLSKWLCSTLEGCFLFYPLVSSHFAAHGSHPNTFFIQHGSSPEQLLLPHNLFPSMNWKAAMGRKPEQDMIHPNWFLFRSRFTNFFEPLFKDNCVQVLHLTPGICEHFQLVCVFKHDVKPQMSWGPVVLL